LREDISPLSFLKGEIWIFIDGNMDILREKYDQLQGELWER
tara:strand:- start:577 stop:699 length:123 start_codon:yes stop_codon:yes gene_type:complete